MTTVPEPSAELLQRAGAVRLAAVDLGQTSDSQRAEALAAMADALSEQAEAIVEANRLDLERSSSEGLAPALMARLKLDAGKLAGAIDGVRQLAALPDPLGQRQLHRELDDGLVLERITVPLGVVGVIFEARPDAVVQIASLAIRSGNGAMLKGGSEARCTNEAVMEALKLGLSRSPVSADALTLLTTRQESLALLRLDGLVDLIIPRGSNELVRFIQDNTRIPVLGHASIAPAFLASAVPAFQAAGVTLRGDEQSRQYGISEAATDEDWRTEYLDLILSVRVVPSIDVALDHIRRHGSRHTDAIATTDAEAADRFLAAVDSAGVYLNCSTRFADGFRYGFGAEVGISTQTLPPRGPVGLDGLVTYRYRLRGEGHIAADFAAGTRRFSHRDLPL